MEGRQHMILEGAQWSAACRPTCCAVHRRLNQARLKSVAVVNWIRGRGRRVPWSTADHNISLKWSAACHTTCRAQEIELSMRERLSAVVNRVRGGCGGQLPTTTYD